MKRDKCMAEIAEIQRDEDKGRRKLFIFAVCYVGENVGRNNPS